MTHTSIAESRLRIRADAVVLATATGAQVIREDRLHALEGTGVFELLVRLGEHLDGTHTLAEICVGLPEERRRLVYDVCAWLVRHDLAIAIHWDSSGYDSAAATPPTAFWVAERTDGHLARFRSFQRARVLLTGDGVLPLACMNALSALGLERIEVLAGTAHLVRAKELLDSGLTRTPCTLSVCEAGLEEAIARSDQPYDALLICGTEAPSPDAHGAARRAHECGTLALSLSLDAKGGVVGPIPSDHTLACPDCAMRAVAERVRTEPAAVNNQNPVAAAYLADLAAMTVLRRQARMPQGAFANTVVTLCAETFMQKLHKIESSSRCPTCQP